MIDTGKALITLGIIIALVGLFINYGPAIPFLGKLPGDIYIKRDGFSLYLPITTSILLSIIISLLWQFFRK